MAELDLAAIGARIRGRRAQRDLSQQTLASACRIGLRTLVGIERGKQAMTIVTLARIAQALELDVHYILFGNDMGERHYP